MLIASVEKLERVALRLVDLREHPEDAAVDVVHADHALARVDEVHERRRGTDSGGVRGAELRPLERGEAGLERRPRRVRDPRVVVALVDADRLMDVRGRLVDRQRERARRRIRLLALVDRSRLELHYALMLSAPTKAARERSGLSSGTSFSPGSHQTLLTLKHVGRMVEDRVDPADEPVVVQDRQHEVAVLPLGLRDVDLDAEAEVPERLRPLTVADQRVER